MFGPVATGLGHKVGSKGARGGLPECSSWPSSLTIFWCGEHSTPRPSRAGLHNGPQQYYLQGRLWSKKYHAATLGRPEQHPPGPLERGLTPKDKESPTGH